MMRKLTIRTESWPLKTPLRITGRSFDTAEVLVVDLREGEAFGRAEAAGVFYLGETVASLSEEISNVRHAVESGLTRAALQSAMAPGGARNALDCALWDLEAKQRGVRMWTMIGATVAPVHTVNTIGVGSPEEMAAAAATIDSPHIKIKLDAEAPVERVEAIRKARPHAELVIDVNQGWTFEMLKDAAPHMQRLNVRMIEQPLPRGGDSILEGYRSPIPLCADESCLHRGELADAARRYQMINIKLDKTGGLTEALALIDEANRHGLKLMVGNMLGTSLAMAPAFVVAQRCRFVDLDGPTLLAADRDHAMSYAGGRVSVPEAQLWG
jgi:L-alanine-DL-glutamate epimerase-like enolase superfamily enzyme